MATKVRLLKVTVQPVFVLDDGESLTERAAEPLVIQGADWAKFLAEGFDKSVAQIEEALNTPAVPTDPA